MFAARAPKTAIGRCAFYAYSTTAINPTTGALSTYKYPFVYDTATQKCYLLAISAQLLRGEKYCSINGSPAGLTWACFEPQKDLTLKSRYIYGSAYVGEGDPDAWDTNCRKRLAFSSSRAVPVRRRCVFWSVVRGSGDWRLSAEAVCIRCSGDSYQDS